jgi:hypothetical protein
VTDGIVHLWGYLPSHAEADALRVAAVAIPGVRDFEDHTYRYFGDVNIRRQAPSEVTLVEPEEGSWRRGAISRERSGRCRPSPSRRS